MTLFYVDRLHDIRLSYDELVTELVEREYRRPVIKTEDPSEVFIELLLAILGEEELTILDPEFSSETLSDIGYSGDLSSRMESVPEINVTEPEDIVTGLQTASEDWTLGLYTSGTTGTPSRVNQTLEGLTRSVRQDERFRDHVWAFAYNPTHFAGLQVFFQAVMNRNPMIYIFEQPPDQINKSIQEHEITHISATPTFYRLRLQQLDSEYPTVKRLTSGGEKFEPSLREELKARFPNAKFRNVYALTEAGSLLESDGELFRIPADSQDKFEITDENELTVHRSLLSDPSLVNEDDEWFYTGDLVEFVDEDSFRFVGRKSDFVNIGGYRVNPHDVEKYISSVDEVQAVTVTARDSSVTGHILVAEVKPTPDTDPSTVKSAVDDAVTELNRWEQPRVINVVDTLHQSRSGKRVR